MARGADDRSDVATRPVTPRRAVASRWPLGVVLVAYAVLAFGVTWSWWTPLGGRITAINATDATLFSWLLGWTPHALSSGQLPLYSDRLNFPAGVNLMWNNGMVLPAVVFAPVTALFGGLGTVTVLTTLGMFGSAASAFGCLRALPIPGPPLQVLPAALGGALFGFSPAMSAQALGHPNLVFNVLVPPLLLLSARLMTEPAPTRRTAVLLGVTAGAQVLIGEEVLFLTGIAVALLLVVLAAAHPRVARERARVFGARAGLALGVFLLVAGFPLGYQLFGPLSQQGSPFDTAYYSADLMGFVLPTELQALTTQGAVRQARGFAGGVEEHTNYLGWPLLIAVVVAMVEYRRRAAVWVPLLVGLLTAVLALGPRLTVLTVRTGIPLPWALLRGLPGFEHVIVTRFALLTAALFGAGLAVALDSALRGRPAVRTAGLFVAVGALLPLLPAPLPGAPAPRVPEFFTARAATELACPGGSALVLPFPRTQVAEPLLWQQASGMAFAMPGGYFIGPGPNGRAYVHGTPTRTGLLFAAVARDGRPRPVTPQLRQYFADDLARWNVCAAVLGPGPNRDALRAQATALIGREPEAVDGVFLWRDLAAG
ncbi:MAG TPA: hypothetical protein VNO83_20315 [Pseudonocardia sp.]|nr:hypothetical protein [Pseudonocardia sp.]